LELNFPPNIKLQKSSESIQDVSARY